MDELIRGSLSPFALSVTALPSSALRQNTPITGKIQITAAIPCPTTPPHQLSQIFGAEQLKNTFPPAIPFGEQGGWHGRVILPSAPSINDQ